MITFYGSLNVCILFFDSPSIIMAFPMSGSYVEPNLSNLITNQAKYRLSEGK